MRPPEPSWTGPSATRERGDRLRVGMPRPRIDGAGDDPSLFARRPGRRPPALRGCPARLAGSTGSRANSVRRGLEQQPTNFDPRRRTADRPAAHEEPRLWVLAACPRGHRPRFLSPPAYSVGPRTRGGARSPSAVAGREAHRQENVARVFPDLDDGRASALVAPLLSSASGSCSARRWRCFDRQRRSPRSAVAGGGGVLDDARAEGRGERPLGAARPVGARRRVARRRRRPLVALGRGSYDPRFSRLDECLRGTPRRRYPVAVQPGAAARILRTLRQGAVLGVPMDFRSRVPSCEASSSATPRPRPSGRRASRCGRAPRSSSERPRPPGGLVVTATRIATGDLAAATRGPGCSLPASTPSCPAASSPRPTRGCGCTSGGRPEPGMLRAGGSSLSDARARYAEAGPRLSRPASRTAIPCGRLGARARRRRRDREGHRRRRQELADDLVQASLSRLEKLGLITFDTGRPPTPNTSGIIAADQPGRFFGAAGIARRSCR